VGSERGLGQFRFSALRVDIKPRSPDSNKTVFFEEALCYRIVWKISVGESDAIEDHFKRVRFIREHMLDAKPKLTRRCLWLGFNVLWMRLVKAPRAVALYV